MIVEKFDQRKKRYDSIPVTKRNAKKIFNISFLDGSGSMNPCIEHGKYRNAYRSIIEAKNDIVNDLKNYKNLESVFGFYEFSGTEKQWIAYGNVNEVEIPQPSRTWGGGTPLYQNLIEVVKTLLMKKDKADYVELNILTDGQDTSHNNRLRLECAQLLEKVQEEDNFTVTFIGTSSDVAYVQNKLNVDASNTLVHENTANSIGMSLQETASSRSNYFNRVSKGLDVKVNFYDKQTNND